MSADDPDRPDPATSHLLPRAPGHASPSPDETLRAERRKSAPPARKRGLLTGTVADSAADRLEALVREFAPFPLQDG